MGLFDILNGKTRIGRNATKSNSAELAFPNVRVPQESINKLARTSNIPSWVQRPQVEILMPVYKHAEYLRASVESVLAQTHNAISLRILDDGSPKPVSETLASLANEKRIILTRQENKGLPLTLKELTTASLQNNPKAEYLSWHSGDNIYTPDSIKTMLDFLVSNPDLTLGYGNIQLIDENGDYFRDSNYRTIDQCIDETSMLNLDYPVSLLSSHNDNFINACFLYRSHFERLLPTYKAEDLGYEDYKHWLMLTNLGDAQHVHTKQALYKYRLHRNSLTSELSQDGLSQKQLTCVRNANFAKKIQSSEIASLLHINKNKIYLQVSTSNTLIDRTKINLIESIKVEVITESNSDTCRHKSHLKYLKSTPFILKKKLPYTQTIPASFEIPEILLKARNRYLGVFGERGSEKNNLGIFTPSDSPNHQQQITNFIQKNPEIGFALIAQSEEERSSADAIYLASSCASNIRIVDTRQGFNPSQQLENTALLHALGSIDAIISLHCFDDKQGANKEITDNTLHPLTDQIDFLAEACFAAAAKTPLIAPAIQHGNSLSPSRTLPHVFHLEYLPGKNPLVEDIKLPDLKKIKKEVDELSCDAVLRAFSQNTIRRQLTGVILNHLIDS